MRKLAMPISPGHQHLDGVRKHRKDDCVNYDSCLKRAAIMNLQSFSCSGCKGFAYTAEHQPKLESRVCMPLADTWV